MDISDITVNDSLRQVTFSNTTGILRDLTPYIYYQIRIGAATVVGLGPLSAPLIIRTEEDGKNYALSVNLTCLINVVFSSSKQSPDTR